MVYNFIQKLVENVWFQRAGRHADVVFPFGEVQDGGGQGQYQLLFSKAGFSVTKFRYFLIHL